jgi:hypothetical protein
MNGQRALDIAPEFIQSEYQSFRLEENNRIKHRSHKWMITDVGHVLCVDLFSRRFIINGTNKFDAVHLNLCKFMATGMICKKKNEFKYDKDLDKVQLGEDYCLVMNDSGIFTFKFM